MNIKIVAVSGLIAVLFVSSIAGTISYYNALLNSKQSKIASLENEIASQNSKIANLKSKVVHINAEEANLTLHLGVTEISNKTIQPSFESLTYDALFIKGTVVNTGNLTAYDAGLRVAAYSANGTLEINMTVPLVHGGAFYMGSDPYYGDVIDFGTDNATQALASELDSAIGSSDSLKLGVLGGGQTVPVNINILHEGIVTKWTISAIWTNPE
jgi:hypothetical protein